MDTKGSEEMRMTSAERNPDVLVTLSHTEEYQQP